MAIAQTAPPTDTDLHAAYCSQLLSSNIDWLTSIANVAEAGPAKDAIVASVNEERAKLRRVLLYLTPRTSHIDVLGLLGAQTAAKDDAAQVEAWSKRTKCQAECPNPSASDWEQCQKTCVAREFPDEAAIQKKAKSCHELDWLPF